MAILEFGTRGRIDSDRRKGNRMSRRDSGATEECDGGLAILPPVPVARQALGTPVLDAQHAREGDGEPAFRHRGGETEIVRRVGEGYVVGARPQPVDKAERVLAMDVHRVAGTQRVDVRLYGAQAGGG